LFPVLLLNVPFIPIDRVLPRVSNLCLNNKLFEELIAVKFELKVLIVEFNLSSPEVVIPLILLEPSFI
jgi:hypothetical protein